MAGSAWDHKTGAYRGFECSKTNQRASTDEQGGAGQKGQPISLDSRQDRKGPELQVGDQKKNYTGAGIQFVRKT